MSSSSADAKKGEGGSALPSQLQEAVLVRSEAMPEGSETVKGKRRKGEKKHCAICGKMTCLRNKEIQKKLLVDRLKMLFFSRRNSTTHGMFFVPFVHCVSCTVFTHIFLRKHHHFLRVCYFTSKTRLRLQPWRGPPRPPPQLPNLWVPGDQLRAGGGADQRHGGGEIKLNYRKMFFGKHFFFDRSPGGRSRSPKTRQS